MNVVISNQQREIDRLILVIDRLNVNHDRFQDRVPAEFPTSPKSPIHIERIPSPESLEESPITSVDPRDPRETSVDPQDPRETSVDPRDPQETSVDPRDPRENPNKVGGQSPISRCLEYYYNGSFNSVKRYTII